MRAQKKMREFLEEAKDEQPLPIQRENKDFLDAIKSLEELTIMGMLSKPDETSCFTIRNWRKGQRAGNIFMYEVRVNY